LMLLLFMFHQLTKNLSSQIYSKNELTHVIKIIFYLPMYHSDMALPVNVSNHVGNKSELFSQIIRKRKKIKAKENYLNLTVKIVHTESQKHRSVFYF